MALRTPSESSSSDGHALREDTVAGCAAEGKDFHPALDTAQGYAWHHGLVVDFRQATSQAVKTGSEFFQRCYRPADDYPLTACTIPLAAINDSPPDERTKNEFLNGVLQFSATTLDPGILRANLRGQTARILLHELPILRNDTPLDLIQELDTAVRRRRVRLARTRLPLIPIDEAADEGLISPPWADGLRMHFDNNLQTEGVQNLMDLEYYDFGCHYDTPRMTDAIFDLIKTEDLTSELEKHRVNPFTPPLMPLSPSCSPFVPDNESCGVGCRPAPQPLLSEDLMLAEEHLVAQYEHQGLNEAEMGSLDASPPPLLQQNTDTLKLSDLKVEVPLPMTQTSPPAVVVDPLVNASIHPVDDQKLLLLRSPTSQTSHAPGDGRHSENDTLFKEGIIGEQIRNIGEAVHRRATQERLSDLESHQRLPVPVLDFTIPAPAWAVSPATPMAAFRSRISTSILSPSTQRNAGPKLEKLFRWNPFANCATKPGLHDEFLLGKGAGSYLNKEKPFSLISKTLSDHETLIFLGGTWDPGDELDMPAKKPDPTEISDLVVTPTRKRTIPDAATAQSISKRMRPVDLTSVSEGKQHGQATMEQLLCASNDCGPQSLLASYLHHRAPEKVYSTKSDYFFTKPAPAPDNGSQPKSDTKQAQHRTYTPVPFPDIDSKELVGRYIVSITLGKGVIQLIEKFAPRVVLFDREFSNQSTGENSSTCTGFQTEADVSLSPATGIIVANFIQLRQKPLPGQDQRTQIQERIERVASLYQNLMVLIAVDYSPLPGLAHDDTKTYADFTAFTTTTGSSIHVYLVASGDEALATWIAFFMKKFSHETGRVCSYLTLEETSWERFLRQSGMNIYASQVLAGSLKTAYGVSGLTRFIQMKVEDRIDAFADLLGGLYLIERTSRWIDGRCN